MRRWALVTLLCAACASAQDAAQTARQELYHDVVDRAFPIPDDAGMVFTLSVQIRPAFDPDAQFVIQQPPQSAARARLCSAKRNIDEAFGEAERDQANSDLDAETIVASAGVACSDLALPADRAAAWYAEIVSGVHDLLARVQEDNERYLRSGQLSIALDAPYYRIFLENRRDSFSWNIYACGAHTTDTRKDVPPLCHTIERIRGELSAMVQSK